jgi:hypothetical protein
MLQAWAGDIPSIITAIIIANFCIGLSPALTIWSGLRALLGLGDGDLYGVLLPSVPRGPCPLRGRRLQSQDLCP